MQQLSLRSPLFTGISAGATDREKECSVFGPPGQTSRANRPPGDSQPQSAAGAALAAFDEIFTTYQTPIYNYVLRMMGDAEEANDITQDVFIKAYQGLPKLEPDADLNISAWLYRIATNTCLDALRRRKLVRWIPIDIFGDIFQNHGDAGGDPEYTVLQHENQAIVQQVLAKMKQNYRTSLILREFQELSCDEIAVIMGTSRNNVKTMLFRAREQFRQIYESLAAEAQQ